MNHPDGWIQVRAARTHNLHNVNLDLPLGRISVITGPSGSGKSSLVFDTIHAEAQRRFLETVAADARELFPRLKRPEADLIEGLPPTLCVSQQNGPPRPRSTLATITEIHDHCRLLFARLGLPHCFQCGRPVYRHSLTDIARQTLASPEGRKIYVLAPLVRGQAGDSKEALDQIRQGGFLRARVDGVLHEVRADLRLNPRHEHTIELVIDRLVVRPNLGERLTESLGAALKQSGGAVIVTDIDDGEWHDQPYNTVLECPACRIALPEPEPRLFSFNNPRGACPRCGGLGWINEDAATPPPFRDDESGEHDLDEQPESMELDVVRCPECGGARLNPAARAVTFAGKSLDELMGLTVESALPFFQNLAIVGPRPQGLERVQHVLIEQIVHRLRFLGDVGLGYLTLDRPAPSLSGGELQRARLATHLGGGLVGVCYILDEPTIGLHPRDTARLIAALRCLQARGNTVIVVEHDEAVIRQADYLVDMGPAAGPNGGRLLASGTLPEVLANPASVTAPYLNNKRTVTLAGGPPEPANTTCAAPSSPILAAVRSEGQGIVIHGARHHNLKDLTVFIPLGKLTCLTGVSGSGKSSLGRDILCNAARRHLGLLAPKPGPHDRIDGLDLIDRVIEVDQRRLGGSARSNPASYTGVYDEIRKIFAATRSAKARGYKANRFSFNVVGGRCEECRGQGSLAIPFVPEVTVPCPSCRGKRFNRATLEVRYKDRTIADVLEMPIEEARGFFANIPPIERVLAALADIGLGYLCLGQPSSTLSGGEAQRVKLAAELAKSTTGCALFLLDEPTTGLHFGDVANLLRILQRLVASGNTLVVIEHHLDVITAADWVLDLGPDGGAAGGYLLAAGPPAEVARCASSITGRFLSASTAPL